MPTDKPRPAGLLSRVARLVRRTDPAFEAASAPEPAPSADDRGDFDASLSKQALRELIEQRRHNDFVRRREFAQLRRLRAGGAVPADPRGASTLAPQTRASAYFTGEADARLAEDRAGTLRKIDEIEAQMSQQWWRLQQHPAAGEPARTAAPRGAVPVLRDPPSPGAAAPEAQDAADATFASTDIAGATQAMDMASTLPGGPWIAEDLPAFAHLPALDAAAVAFAQADFDGAEAELRALTGADAPAGGPDAGPDPALREPAWRTLFDFYRATARPARFEAAALDYAQRFERSPPSWGVAGWTPDLLGPLDALAGGSAGAGDAGDDAFRWASPAILDAAAVEALGAAFDGLAPPVERHLDWSPLEALADDAADPLASLVAGWILQPLALRFAGAARLAACVGERTPSNDASVPARWWQLRMDLLRLTDRPEAFDMVALDYCITYEVSPPSWQAARCDYRDLPSGGAEDAAALAAAPAGPDALDADPVLELAGELLGDAGDAVARLDAAAARSPRLLTVQCERLLRVDFVAAGALLNWATAQQAAGRTVRFHNLHRLVAGFFHVMGVGEHALLHVRAD
ncbi:MAG: STAS domain-containing protein [Xylophilus ampelinus]